VVIYRLTDRIPVKIGPVTFHLSPLSHYQKAALLDFRRQMKGEEIVEMFKLTERVLACSIKKVDGLTLTDGTDYELSFDQNGELTSDCVGELMQLDSSDKLIEVAQKFAFQGIADLGLDGVEIDLGPVAGVEKKSSAQRSARSAR